MSDVPARRLLRPLGVVRRDGLRDHPMLVDGGCDPAGNREVGAAQQGHRVLQGLHRLEQEPVMRGRIDAFVEKLVLSGMDARVGGQRELGTHMRPKHLDVGRIGVTRRQRGGRAFEQLADVVEFGNGRRVVDRNRQTAARTALEQSLGLKSPQRLAHRGPADPQPGTDLRFEQAASRLDCPCLDRIAKPRVGRVGEALRRRGVELSTTSGSTRGRGPRPPVRLHTVSRHVNSSLALLRRDVCRDMHAADTLFHASRSRHAG